MYAYFITDVLSESVDFHVQQLKKSWWKKLIILYIGLFRWTWGLHEKNMKNKT